MANYTYDSLTNDKVQFLQGLQADLNDYLPDSTDTTKRGAAQEGAFYLTTDTHRLYVGRKVTSGTDSGKVFPEEVSTGIATVVDTGELTAAQTGKQAHDGDFYYIKSSNVLAVYEEDGNGGGSWVQINPATGISSFSHTVADASSVADPSQWASASDKIKINAAVGTTGNANPIQSGFYIKAGDNVTLKRSSDNTTVEISSANSQSTLKVSDNAVTAATNSAPVILTDGVNADTSVYFSGVNDTTVESKVENSQNKVIIAGPGIKGTKITQRGNAGATSGNSGFNIAVSVQNGNDTSTVNDRSTANSVLDPSIKIGQTTTKTSKFYGGEAVLDVYTSGEVNDKINAAIDSALQVTDALRYKGTVASAAAVAALTNLSIGDVYKASADFTYTDSTHTSGVNVKTGDLFIAQGTESYTASNDTTVTSGKKYYTRSGSNPNYVYTLVSNPTGNPKTSSYYEYTGISSVTWEIIPSGNEPWLRGRVGTNSSNPYFGLEDRNIAGDYDSNASETVRLNKRPLNITFDNANSTLIQASGSGTADDFKITLNHTAPSSGSAITISSPTTMVGTSVTGTDSLTTKDAKAKFIALQSIQKDTYGHVTSVTGQEIVLQHNYLTKLSASHSATNNIGTITLGAEDKLGITQTSGTLTKGSVKIGSDTLNITAASNNTQLNINLVWKDF